MSTDSYSNLNPRIIFLTESQYQTESFSFVAEPVLRQASRWTELAAVSLGGNAAGFCGEWVKARRLAPDRTGLQAESACSMLLQVENAFSDFEIIMHSWKL